MWILFTLLLVSRSPVGFVSAASSTWGIAPRQISLEVMDAMKESGAGWVRLWFNWYQIEHDSGTYDWSNVDSIVSAYSNRGFNLYVTLQGGNPYYDTLTFYPESLYPYPQYGVPPVYQPEALDAWLDFVSASVSRYGDKVKYWSIWNEPNLRDYWPPLPDWAGYLELVRATSDLIRSIDSEAKIITGNTSLIDFNFLGALLDSLVDYTDYIGFHPYRLYAEDDQDNFPVAWMIVDSTPMTSFDEEMDSLLSLLRGADPTGRVRLWDEESGFSSHPDPILWEEEETCDTVQAKNVLRKYLLDFSYFVEVSTYWGDYDVNSMYYNALGENWVERFYDMTLSDWYDKEFQFLFNYIALTYTPSGMTQWKEAEDYDTISGNLALSGDSTYIFYPDTFPDGIDTLTYARYTIDVPSDGEYTLWMHMRNPDSTKIPVWLGTFDYEYFFFLATKAPFDSLNRFIWILPFDAESLTGNAWWSKGPHLFSLEEGQTTLTVFPYHAGSELDKIGLKLEAPSSHKKLSYFALKNLAKVWDGRWVRDTSLFLIEYSETVPDTLWEERRIFAFRDTLLGRYGLIYWLGVPPYDDFFPDYQMEVTLRTTEVNEPAVVDFIDGSITPVSYTLTDTTVLFPDLAVSDVPRLLALDINSLGLAERTISAGSSLKILMPSLIEAGDLEFRFSLPFTSPVEFKIYDRTGRKIKQGFLGSFLSGVHKTRLTLTDFPSGLYFFSLKAGMEISVRKFILLR